MNNKTWMRLDNSNFVPCILVQLLILVSNPTKLPCFVHTSAAVPFITSISIDVTAILTFLASTLNINPFRLIHLRVVDGAPSTTSLTHVGAGSLNIALVGNDVGIFVVGFTVGLIVVAFVGCRDDCFTVGLAVGCRDDGFIDGLAVGFLDVGATVGRVVGDIFVGFDVGDFVVGDCESLDARISIGTSLLLNNLNCPSTTAPSTSMPYPPSLFCHLSKAPLTTDV